MSLPLPLGYRPTTGRAIARGIRVATAVLVAGSAFGLHAEPLVDIVPAPTRALPETDATAARALARLQRQLATGDLAGAEQSLVAARRSKLLTDYVALFEARLLLAGGDAAGAAAAAQRGLEVHAGAPIAAAFSELLGESRLAQGDEQGARRAWQLAYEATHSTDRRAALESRIVASHERTGTLTAALERSPDETAVADGSGLPSGVLARRSTVATPEDLLRRADRLMDAGLSEEAIREYDAALAAGLSDASARRARLARGHALFRIRRYTESTAAFAELLPDPEPRFWHARSLARSGRVPASIRAFLAIGESEDPVYGSWALYLGGTLLEDRGDTERAMNLYEEVARRDRGERGRDALWRVGWSAFQRDQHARAREVFQQLAARSEDPLAALRPRYWAARAMEAGGDAQAARTQYRVLVSEYPLSYYGWRAAERLRVPPTIAGDEHLAPGSSRVDVEDVHRVEALLLAELRELAQEELAPIGSRARGLEDRKAVGRLYWLAGDYHRAQRLVVDAYGESLSRGVTDENRVLWQLSWPAAYREIVREVFPENATIEPALVWAIMREESGYRPRVTSSAGARGLLQIMPETGEQLAKRNGLADFDPNDLYTPEVNIALGAAYLDELSRRFPGRLSAAIGSYNAGPRAVSSWLQGPGGRLDDDAWVEDIPYTQTRAYVKRVLRSLHVYRSFYGDRALMGGTADPDRAAAREG